LNGNADKLIATSLYNSLTGLTLGADHTKDGPDRTYFYGSEGATLLFDRPMRAVGILFDVAANTNSYAVEVPEGTAVTGSSAFDFSTFVFAGLASPTPFRSVRFYSTSDTGNYTVAAIMAAEKFTPEPGTWTAAVGAGLILLGSLRRKKR
jgi:hypothetical protein